MLHEGHVWHSFNSLLLVRKGDGCCIYPLVGLGGKRTRLCLGTLQVESLNLDSSCHMEARNRTSKLSVFPHKNLASAAAWEKHDSIHKASPMQTVFFMIFSKLLSYVFSKIII